jgi:hypothetical protein
LPFRYPLPDFEREREREKIGSQKENQETQNSKIMRSLYFTPPATPIPIRNPRISLTNGAPELCFPVSFQPIQPLKHSFTVLKSQSHPNPQSNAHGGGGGEEDPDAQDAQVQDLRVPEHWSVPSKALEV